jgi:hypothetical protein
MSGWRLGPTPTLSTPRVSLSSPWPSLSSRLHPCLLPTLARGQWATLPCSLSPCVAAPTLLPSLGGTREKAATAPRSPRRTWQRRHLALPVMPEKMEEAIFSKPAIDGGAPGRWPCRWCWNFSTMLLISWIGLCRKLASSYWVNLQL